MAAKAIKLRVGGEMGRTVEIEAALRATRRREEQPSGIHDDASVRSRMRGFN